MAKLSPTKTPRSTTTTGGDLPVLQIDQCCPTGLRTPLSRDEADRLARVLKAVADPTRLQLLTLIRASGEACACDLNDPVGLSQPTVSHHLKVLTEAGLVHRRQRGQWAWFSVDEDSLAALGSLFS